MSESKGLPALQVIHPKVGSHFVMAGRMIATFKLKRAIVEIVNKLEAKVVEKGQTGEL